MNKKLESVRACREAIKWVGDKDLRAAWEECERGDWMLWIARRRNVDLKKRTMAKVKCARLVQHLMKDVRSLKALDVAEKFALGEATREELDAAAAAAAAAYAANAYAADAAAYAAADATDVAAAYAAADAADAADAAAAYATDVAAAYAAADAADAADAAAAYAANAYARQDILSKSADFCRQVIDFGDLNMDAIEER